MTVYKDPNGTVWMVNLIDVTELPDIVRSTVASWLDTDRTPHRRTGTVDDIWYPLAGDDAEQVEARCDLLRKGTLTGQKRSVRVKGRRSLP